MADVTLKLRADNSDYVRKIKEAQNASQKLNSSVQDGQKTRMGLIEREIKLQDQLRDKRERAMNKDNIKLYNQLLSDSKKRMEELNNLGKEQDDIVKKSDKSTNTLVGSIGKWAAASISLRGGLTLLKNTLGSFYIFAQEGMDTLERKTNGWKAALMVLRGEFVKVGKAFNDNVATEENGRKLNNLITYTKDFFNLLTGGLFKNLGEAFGINGYFRDLGQRMDEAASAAEAWTKKEQEIRDLENSMIVPRAKANNALREARELYASGTGTIQERIDAIMAANRLEEETAAKEQEIARQRVEVQKEINRLKEESGQLTREDERLLQQYMADEIDLSTQSKSRMIEALNIVRTLRRELLRKEPKLSMYNNAMGLSDAEIKELIERLEKVKKNFDELLDDANKKVSESGKKAKAANDAIAADNRTAFEKEQWDERVKAAKLALSEITSFITTLADRQAEDAQRNREILDTRISELEDELQTEAELYAAGYASNVSLKKKELEDLKKVRAQALKDEEEAIKRQRAMESIAQGVNIFTLATQILKAFTKNLGPIGLALAAGAITAMFALVANWKSKSFETTKLAKGGSGDTGTIHGRSHARGGERSLDHVEVEKGESWGVLSIPATQKFGKVFHHMVSSFNRGEIPKLTGMTASNSVLVENNGPNSRLDKVIQEQKILNKKLSNMDSLNDYGDRVIIRRGNTTRIINR